MTFNQMLAASAIGKLSNDGWASLTPNMKTAIGECLLGNLPKEFIMQAAVVICGILAENKKPNFTFLRDDRVGAMTILNSTSGIGVDARRFMSMVRSGACYSLPVQGQNVQSQSHEGESHDGRSKDSPRSQKTNKENHNDSLETVQEPPTKKIKDEENAEKEEKVDYSKEDTALTIDSEDEDKSEKVSNLLKKILDDANSTSPSTLTLTPLSNDRKSENGENTTGLADHENKIPKLPSFNFDSAYATGLDDDFNLGLQSGLASQYSLLGNSGNNNNTNNTHTHNHDYSWSAHAHNGNTVTGTISTKSTTTKTSNKTVTSTQVQIYYCSYCPHSTKRKHELVDHERKHGDIYYFGCHICDYISKQHSSMKNHYYKEHGRKFNLELVRKLH